MPSRIKSTTFKCLRELNSCCTVKNPIEWFPSWSYHHSHFTESKTMNRNPKQESSLLYVLVIELEYSEYTKNNKTRVKKANDSTKNRRCNWKKNSQKKKLKRGKIFFLKCSTHLEIEEMQIREILRSAFTTVRMRRSRK